MRNRKSYPTLVKKLTTLCEGWLVGSSALPDNHDPRDWDIFIPFSNWSNACGIIPADSKLNSFGGFKCMSDEKEVDVWTGSFEELLTSAHFKYAYHPKTNTYITKNT
jgi:hypothetical protein